MSWDPVANPCPWWSPAEARAHAAWLAEPPPPPLAYEALDPCRQWPSGQPVTLMTQGIEHLTFVRLCGCTFAPRWLAGSIPERRVSPVELTTRNPRELWGNAYELQLALALLAARTDPRCAWLSGPYDPDEEPELEALYALAFEELDRRQAPAQLTGPMPDPPPTPQRVRSHAELEALRMSEGVIQPVDLAPGR